MGNKANDQGACKGCIYCDPLGDGEAWCTLDSKGILISDPGCSHRKKYKPIGRYKEHKPREPEPTWEELQHAATWDYGTEYDHEAED